jgi:hypothetical protein
MDPMWKTYQFIKNAYTFGIVRYGLTEIMGERDDWIWWDYTDAERLAKTKGQVTIPKKDGQLWPLIRKLSTGKGVDLFYNANGAPVVRKRRPGVVFTFDDNWLVSKPEIQYSDEVKNIWEVLGRKPKGQSRIRAVAVADRSTGMHPTQIGLHGNERYRPGFFKSNAITTKGQALNRAEELLEEGLELELEMTAEILPWPFAEPYDLIRIRTGDINHKMRLRQWSHPILPGRTTVGWMDNVKTNRQLIRPR